MEERPARKLIDWNSPVRSIDNPACIGIVKAADGISGKQPVWMRHDCAPGDKMIPENERNWTTFRYDEYGRCHSHKWPSPYDLENFDPRNPA